MRNSIFATLSIRCRLLTFLLVFAGIFQASAQIDVDDFNTGPFTIYGISSSNDIIATGAIEGKRDAKIANLVSSTSFANKTLETTGAYAGALKITPYGNSIQGVFPGNYDIGWGNNDVLGGTDMNLNAADYSQIEVTFRQSPFYLAQMNVRFNKPGDPDYSSSALVTLNGGRSFTFPFSSFSGLNPADIDGISIGFSNCGPDTIILIDHIKISGFLDSDNDGIGNGSDNCPAIANSNQADLDDDGIGDACDACPNDPQNDADGDGVCANVDNCPNVPNSNQADADDDGIGDACDTCPNDPQNDADGDDVCANVDNCPNVPNSNQADADNDGIGDACDACPNDPNNDGDGDGVCGNVDNCLNVANANQADADNDGIGDACDACPNDAANDADGDGICGNIDNCPGLANPDQTDANNNGIGDACDGKPTIIDADDDGIADDVDNCPDVANRNQRDSDGDGIGNACDPCTTAIPNLANFNTTTCHCNPGYYEVIGSLGYVKLCRPCPAGQSCPDGINAYPLPRALDGDTGVEGLELVMTPNPAADVVRLQLGGLSGQQEVALEIYNSLGQLMLRKAFGKVTYLNEQLNVSTLPSGIYLLEIRSGTTRMTRKLVVER